MKQTINYLIALALSLSAATAYSQNPGNVTSPAKSLWFDPASNLSASSWASRVNTLTISGSAAAKSNGDRAHNFQPYVSFNSTSQYFTAPASTYNRTSYDFFGVYRRLQDAPGSVYSHFWRFETGVSGAHNYGIGFNTITGDNITLHYIGGAIGTQSGGAAGSQSGPVTMVKGTPLIAHASITTSSTYSIGGNNSDNSGNATSGALGTLGSYNNLTLGGGSPYGMTGDAQEILYYSSNLATADRVKVYTYLAIKYGITLINTNYTISSGTTIWNAGTNAAYKFNVAGIGKDANGFTNTKQSNSVEPAPKNASIPDQTYNVVISAGTTLAATNAANTTSLTDNAFMVWGDNGDAAKLTGDGNTANISGGTAYTSLDGIAGRRLNRIWKVQNTGFSQNLTFEILESAIAANTGGTCAAYKLLMSTDPTFSSGVTEFGAAKTTDALVGSGNVLKSNVPTSAAVANTTGTYYFTWAKFGGVPSGVAYLPQAEVTPGINGTFTCNGTNGYTYYKLGSDNTYKYLAVKWGAVAVPSGFAVNIHNGGGFAHNTPPNSARTNIMQRMYELLPHGASLSAPVTIRLYYDPAEIAASLPQDVKAQSWFKFGGSYDDFYVTMGNFNSAGLPPGCQILTPSATGVEDGINYIEFDNITSFSTIGYVATNDANALSSSFGTISAILKGGQLQVSWTTLAEKNTDHFEIEASADGKNFKSIGTVVSKAAGGDSSSTLNYEFTKNLFDVQLGVLLFGAFFGLLLTGKKYRKLTTGLSVVVLAITIAFVSCSRTKDVVDNGSNKKMYIRIKSVDKDGTVNYSNVISVVKE